MSEQERKQSVAHEGVAVSEKVKLVSTCEQKVTFCDEELPTLLLVRTGITGFSAL